VKALGLLLAGCASAGAAPARDLVPVGLDALCVTHGALAVAGGRAQISEASVRAFARGSDGDRAALRFRYAGRAEKVSALGSGAVRAQLGLKLRAQDGCNLIYVMWRFEPKAELVVQVKRNPGAHTHAECGTGGYTRIKPARSAPVAAAAPGSEHLLEATIEGETLTARIDGAEVWKGALPDAARELAGGPAGLRGDNVAADVELSVLPGRGGADARCPAPAAADE
jgi:hypothetical protein